MGKVTQDRGCSIVGTERERGDTKIATEGEVSGGVEETSVDTSSGGGRKTSVEAVVVV